jgi:hypothetical protein
MSMRKSEAEMCFLNIPSLQAMKKAQKDGEDENKSVRMMIK